ncbi:MAG: hypothetical protein K8T20_04650 [Planctomycetes bacterium]|nr:hypothetical protein [Planctomycetota bacterium]
MNAIAVRAFFVSLAFTVAAFPEEPEVNGHCGGKTAAAWAAVLKSSGKKSGPETAQAVLALRRIGAGARDAVPALAGILKSPGYDPRVYRDIAEILARQGTDEALDALAASISSPVAEARSACLSEVSLRFGGDIMPAKLVPALAKLLADKDDRTAQRAAEILGEAREEARTVVTSLAGALSRDATRLPAATALVAVGNPGCAALRDVDAEIARLEKKSLEKGIKNAAELKDQAKKLRVQGDALRALQSTDGKTFEQWKAALGSAKAEERIAALKAFGALRADPAFRVEAAAKFLKDPEQGVRQAGFNSLASWGGRARQLYPPVVQAMIDYVAPLKKDEKDNGDGIHWMDLCGTLAGVAGPDSIPTLCKLGREGQSFAVRAVGKFGPAAAPAAEDLAAILVAEPVQRPSREWAGEALAGIGPLDAATSGKIAPMLLKAMQLFDYEDNSARANALATLRAGATIPPEAEQLLLDLIARDKELLHEKLERVLALVDRFPGRKADFRELFEQVCFGEISWDIKGLQSAAFLAELAPDTKGLAAFILKNLDYQAGQLSLKAEDKDRSDAPQLLWILRGVRALGPAAAKARASVERALWAEDVRVRDAARETLKVLK